MGVRKRVIKRYDREKNGEMRIEEKRGSNEKERERKLDSCVIIKLTRERTEKYRLL